MLEDPYEVWLAFGKSKKTGLVALRLHYIKAFKGGDGFSKKGLLFVADAHAGMLNGWTVFPWNDTGRLNARRAGKLLYSRD